MVITLKNSFNESFDSFFNNIHIEVVNSLNECEYTIFNMINMNEASVEDVKFTIKRTIDFVINKAKSIIDTFIQNVFEKIDSIKSRLRNIKNGKHHIDIIDANGNKIKVKSNNIFNDFKKKAKLAADNEDSKEAIEDTKNIFENFRKAVQEMKDALYKNIKHYKKAMSSPKVNEDGIIDVEWEPV